MGFESFYGGRMGASFIIVKQFDGIDIPQVEGSYVYKIKRYATTSDSYLIYNDGFIERTADNYLHYTWTYVALDGEEVLTKRFEGDTATYKVKKPIKLQEGMRQCFEQGGDTTDEVNYGEYVMIVAANENDPDNGKVYRRGMNFDYNPETNPLAGAVYIGQTRGPKGEVTKVDFDHYNQIWNRYHDSNDPALQRWYEGETTYTYILTTDTQIDKEKIYYELNGDIPPVYNQVYPIGTENPSVEGWYEREFTIVTYTISTDERVNITKTYYRLDVDGSAKAQPKDGTNPYEQHYYEKSGTEISPIYTSTTDIVKNSGKTYYRVVAKRVEDFDHYVPVTVDEYTPSGEDIIPGYYLDEEGNPQYEDNIKYIYVQFVDEYGQAEGTVIGFKIPTLVQEFESRSMSPYQQRKIDPVTGRYYNDDLVYEDPEQYIDTKWQHPFYQKWQIKVPNGYHGVDSTNIEIVHTKTKPEGFEDYINYDALYNYDEENDIYTIATDVESTIEKNYWNLTISSKNFSYPLTPEQQGINPSEEGYYEKNNTSFIITEDTEINVDKTYFILTPIEVSNIKRHYAGTPVYDDEACTIPHLVNEEPLILTSSVDILKENENTIYKYFNGTDPNTGESFTADTYIYDTRDEIISCRINYNNEILYVKKEDCYMDVIRYRETSYENYGDDNDIYGNQIGEVRYYYLGAYNEIIRITLSENGTLTTFYTGAEKSIFDQAIRWIDTEHAEGITLDDHGTLKMYYNTLDQDGKHEQEEWYQKLQWIDSKNADGITFDDDGTVRVFYNTLDEIGEHNKEEWIQKIRWIDTKNTEGITFDDYGTVKVFYNTFHDVIDPETGEVTKERDIEEWYQKIRWINKGMDMPVTIDDDGTISVYYNTLHDVLDPETGEPVLDPDTGEVVKASDVNVFRQVLRWIDNVHTNGIEISDDGTVTVYYNTFHDAIDPDTGATIKERDTNVFSNVLDWITQVTLSQEGVFNVLYNNNTIQNGRYTTILNWIDLVQLDEDGTIKFYFNSDHDIPAFEFTKRIKYLSNVQIQNTDPTIEDPEPADEGTGDQKIHLTYNTGDTEAIGEPLNYIIEAVISSPDPINYPDVPYSHLLIYYSDPALRAIYQDKWVTYKSTKYPGHEWTEWIDFGDIRGSQGGIHILEDIDDLDKLKDGEGHWIPPERLVKTDDPTEYVRPDGAGWCVTYTPAGQVNPTIFCYDYNTEEWYSLGIVDPLTIIVKSIADENQLPNPLDVITLKENGIWLAEETVYYAF